MAFRPVKYDSGKVVSLPVKALEVITKWNHCLFASGYMTAGAAGDNEAEYIALETVTGGATDGVTMAAFLPVDDEVEYEALCQDTPVQATHVGNNYDFQSAAQLDLDAATDKVFHIDSIVNASDKLVKG